MNFISKIAKLLRTPEEIVLRLEEEMNAATGKSGIFEKIYQENQQKIEQKLSDLKVVKRDAKTIYEKLITKVEQDDKLLFNFFNKPKFNKPEGCRLLIDFLNEFMGQRSGFFLSLDKAKELLKLNPPQNILKILKYKSIDELLVKEDILEVFSALRFAEDKAWLNDVFFRPYNEFKKEDFEERSIQVRVLPEKWLKVGEKFTGKKLHNISHLKELGIIFVIPSDGSAKGQTIELLTLILHYFFEVGFYAKIFGGYAETDNFGQKIISALRGDVGGLPLPDSRLVTWRIVQRYLAKDDINDPRLFEPHINPEAVHWVKAEKEIARLNQKFSGLDLATWEGLDWAGDYFPLNNTHGEILISFDLIDNIISLTKRTTVMSKYLYHQQEALWNRIFIEYLGEDKLEQLLRENLDKGHISLEIKK